MRWLMEQLRRLGEVRARPLSRRARTVVSVVSVIAVVVLVTVAWRERPDVDDAASWAKLAVVALVLTPLTFGVKAFEYRAAGLLVGQRPRLADAYEVAVRGASANLLPLPGSAVVTAHALSSSGSTLKRSAASTATVGLAWLGVSIPVGGAVLAASGSVAIGLALAGGGLVLAAVTWLSLRPQVAPGGRARAALSLAAVELGFIAVTVARLWFVASALGYDIEWWQLAAFPMASALSAVVGFLPAVFGIREGLMALIAPAVGLTVADGLVLGLIEGIAWMVGLGIVSAVLFVLGRRSRPTLERAGT